jgi:hypothetical protein
VPGWPSRSCFLWLSLLKPSEAGIKEYFAFSQMRSIGPAIAKRVVTAFETPNQVGRDDGSRLWLPFNGVLDSHGSLVRLNPSRVPVQDRQVEATP